MSNTYTPSNIAPHYPLNDSYVISQDVSALTRTYLNTPYVSGPLGTGPADSTVTITDVAADRRDYVTMTGMMDVLSNGPQSHRQTFLGGRVWPLVCVFLGMVLMAVGFVFTDPVARAVWSLIH